ncbi:MAG: hypothetical protein H6696_10045 [Deferribacteres bacterium]|nr:hypothetical protein [candidate division KSB1 bacterium]MCB9502269.1 hypothetical protein [Deferribacteres bacterium]
MNNKNYIALTGIFFGFVALGHLIRLILQLEILIDSWPVPMWISWAGFIGPAFFSMWALKLARN